MKLNKLSTKRTELINDEYNNDTTVYKLFVSQLLQHENGYTNTNGDAKLIPIHRLIDMWSRAPVNSRIAQRITSCWRSHIIRTRVQGLLHRRTLGSRALRPLWGCRALQTTFISDFRFYSDAFLAPNWFIEFYNPTRLPTMTMTAMLSTMTMITAMAMITTMMMTMITTSVALNLSNSQPLSLCLILVKRDFWNEGKCWSRELEK